MFNVFTLMFLGLSLCINLVEGSDGIKISNLKKACVCLRPLLWEDVCFACFSKLHLLKPRVLLDSLYSPGWP